MYVASIISASSLVIQHSFLFLRENQKGNLSSSEFRSLSVHQTPMGLR